MWLLPVPLLPTAMTFSRRLDVLRAGQLQHQCLVERRQRQEVEAVEALDRREPRLLDPALDHAPFALDQLQFGQPQQIARYDRRPRRRTAGRACRTRAGRSAA